MTHSKSREVRRAAINQVRAPFTPQSLIFLGKRLRDKDPEIRKITFQKLTKNKTTLEAFQSYETRMLIMKEGLTDQNEGVRMACSEFMK